MPPVRNLRPGYTVIYPNRGKAASKVTKAIVSLLLLVSVVLILIVTIGGWSKLQGLKPVNLIWAVAVPGHRVLHLPLEPGDAADRRGAGDPAADPGRHRRARRLRHELVRPQSRRLRGRQDAVRRQAASPRTCSGSSRCSSPRSSCCSSSSPCRASPRAGTWRRKCPRTRPGAAAAEAAGARPRRRPRRRSPRAAAASNGYGGWDSNPHVLADRGF